MEKVEAKSRREKRKESRLEKGRNRFLSWVQHQGTKTKKNATSNDSSRGSSEMKFGEKSESLRKRRKNAVESKSKSNSKFQEFLKMDMGPAAAGAEEDMETERRLAKKLKVKDGRLGGLDDGLNMLFDDLDPIEDAVVNDEVEDGGSEKLLKSKSKKKKKRRENEVAEEVIAGASDTEIIEEPRVEEPAAEGKAKYVAPHLRACANAESEEISQIRRRVRGLLNRLSESNVESITEEVATIFRSVSRSVGCQVIGDEVVTSCSGGPRGNEQYAAVFAAFVSGMACLVGVDFSAKLLASLAKSFEDEYSKEDSLSLRNLTLLLSYLCIFGACSSDLIYDLLSELSKRLTELDVATIVTILQCCGMKLRGDDPSAMKDFVLSIQNRVNVLKSYSEHTQDGNPNINSKRMEFMLETICDIKNNKRRPKEDPAHHTWLKKWLQKVRAEDILLRGLKWSKLLAPEKKGQWWLSGDVPPTMESIDDVATTINMEILEAQKLVQLAAAQRMNTDLRRAIFCIIMSGEDYIDAFEKLLRLDLSGKQDREIMRVLVDCCLHEKMFNKYYTILASKLCSHDKNHKFSLQYCLWDHFKELDTMELNCSMNLARFVAEMLASFSLSLAILKSVDLANPACLTPKRIMHFRVLFESIFENSDTLVWNIFTRIAALLELEMLRSSLVFFIKLYVVAANTEKPLASKFKIAKKALDNVAGILM